MYRSTTRTTAGAAGALAALALAACGGGSSHAAPTTIAVPTTVAPATAPTTAAPATAAPTTAAPTTTAPPPTAPPTTTVVGLALSGAGNTFTAPTAPTTKAYNPNCQSLIDPGFTGSCVVVSGPTGSAAAVVEQQQQNYQAGQPITSGQERDLVYEKVGNAWSLRLRRIPMAGGESVSQVSGSDIMRDGDTKAVFVEPAPNSTFGNELDVVEPTAVVSLYRQLHGGFATVPATGGLTTYVPDAAGGYDQAVIRYSGGAWRIVANSAVSHSQGQAEGDQPFYDPSGIRAAY